MKHAVMSIFESKAEFWLAPFYAYNIADGQRFITERVNDEQDRLSKHAADYNLFHIGYFDDQTGELTQNEGGRVSCGNLLEFKQTV